MVKKYPTYPEKSLLAMLGRHFGCSFEGDTSAFLEALDNSTGAESFPFPFTSTRVCEFSFPVFSELFTGFGKKPGILSIYLDETPDEMILVKDLNSTGIKSIFIIGYLSLDDIQACLDCIEDGACHIFIGNKKEDLFACAIPISEFNK